MKTRELYESTRRLLLAEADRTLLLHAFGDSLQSRKGFPGHLIGIEAVHFLLIQKYRWLPRDVKSMTPEDMLLALEDEMEAWTPPPEAKFKE